MAVKIRLTRKGKKKQPTYRVVVADSRAPRDGRYIEQIGRYDPRQEPSVVVIDNERASYWMSQGAQPSDAVRKLLEISGALEARPVKIKDPKVHVVDEKAQVAAAETDDEVAAVAAEGAAAQVAVTSDAATDEPPSGAVGDAVEDSGEKVPDFVEETAEAAVGGEEQEAGDDGSEE